MISRQLTEFGRARSGAVGLEYAMLVSGIGIVLLAAIYLLGEDMAAYWNALDTSISGVAEQ